MQNILPLQRERGAGGGEYRREGGGGWIRKSNLDTDFSHTLSHQHPSSDLAAILASSSGDLVILTR